MHCYWAAGIAALGLVLQGTAAWSASAVSTASPSYALSPGEYSLQIRLFEDYGVDDDAESMKLSFHGGQIVLQLKDDPQVRFVGADKPNVLMLRYGDGEDDIVLHGRLTADDRIEGHFVIEAYRFGAQHGTFTLVKMPAVVEQTESGEPASE
ncbi:MAG: hypothetical protein QM775_23790 [Pirellulales bacterium]